MIHRSSRGAFGAEDHAGLEAEPLFHIEHGFHRVGEDLLRVGRHVR